MERRKMGKIGLFSVPQSQQLLPKNRENPAVLDSHSGGGEITPRGDWRREGDSNPRYAINVYALSRRAPSAARPSLLRTGEK